jgi:hypothetical protein
MIYRDLAAHHTSTTYDLVYIEQRPKRTRNNFSLKAYWAHAFWGTHVSESHAGLQKEIHLAFRINAPTSFFGGTGRGPGPGHMAGAVMYKQLNQQAAAMAYQDIYRLLSWMGMVACAFILSKTSLVMSSCRSSRALAIFLAMTVMPGQKFHPAAKCVTAAHDAAS